VGSILEAGWNARGAAASSAVPLRSLHAHRVLVLLKVILYFLVVGFLVICCCLLLFLLLDTLSNCKELGVKRGMRVLGVTECTVAAWEASCRNVPW
jgi:hypothetical protein